MNSRPEPENQPMNTEDHRLLPDDLSDEAAAQMLELLYEIARILESQYAGQILRYYHRPNPTQTEIWD
jgi:hypothetical protein